MGLIQFVSIFLRIGNDLPDVVSYIRWYTRMAWDDIWCGNL